METAMTIEVRFPDGSWRDVPSELCPIDSETTGGASRFHHRPIGIDAQWRFVEGTAGWFARPRRGSLAIFSPPAEEWWHGIAVMTDGPDEARAARASRAA